MAIIMLHYYEGHDYAQHTKWLVEFDEGQQMFYQDKGIYCVSLSVSEGQ